MSRFSRASEDGSTILEVMVALLVLSLLGMGAWNAAAVSLRQAGRIQKKVRENAGLLQMDEMLRGMAVRIRAPFWAGEHSLEITDGEAAVPFMDADPEKRLILSFRQNVFSISDGETTVPYPGYTSASFSEARDKDDRICGVTVELAAGDGEGISITARFGSMPLAEAGGR
jgi:Tfp pilus assembly protein PilV